MDQPITEFDLNDSVNHTWQSPGLNIRTKPDGFDALIARKRRFEE